MVISERPRDGKEYSGKRTKDVVSKTRVNLGHVKLLAFCAFMIGHLCPGRYDWRSFLNASINAQEWSPPA